MPATLEPAALTGAELARWLLPLLKEYTDKLNAVCDRGLQLAESQANPLAVSRSIPHAARLLAMRSTYKRLLLGYASRTSAMLDHFRFDDDELKLELIGRWEEAEVAVRASDVVASQLARQLEGAGHGREVDRATEYIQDGTED